MHCSWRRAGPLNANVRTVWFHDENRISGEPWDGVTHSNSLESVWRARGRLGRKDWALLMRFLEELVNSFGASLLFSSMAIGLAFARQNHSTFIKGSLQREFCCFVCSLWRREKFLQFDNFPLQFSTPIFHSILYTNNNLEKFNDFTFRYLLPRFYTPLCTVGRIQQQAG